MHAASTARICGTLSALPSLSYLNLSLCSLTDEQGGFAGTSALADAFLQHASLQELHLQSCGLHPACLTALSPGLERQSALTLLDLSCNPEVSSTGLITLCQHITALSGLENLSLKLCCIELTALATSTLSRALLCLTSLQKLDLMSLRAPAVQRAALVSALLDLVRMRELHLCNTGLTKEHAAMVCSVLRSMPNLSYLNLARNELTARDLRPVTAELPHLEVLCDRRFDSFLAVTGSAYGELL